MIASPRLILIPALVAALLATSGCGRLRAQRGYIADATLTTSIQPGVDNRESVAATLGRPSFEGQFDSRDWYYVSIKTRQLAFRDPKANEQSILHVRFAANGTVEDVSLTGLDKVAQISPESDKTPTLGSERTFFDDLFGNIGSVGAPGAGGAGASNDPTTP